MLFREDAELHIEASNGITAKASGRDTGWAKE
jgi:hypothetical protein